MINTSDIEKAKRMIKAEKRPIIVKAQDDQFNRKILEYGKFDILLDIESGNRKDKLKNIDSGFNEVLASIAYKNKVSLAVNLEEIKSLPKKDKALRFSKIMQNLRIARKKKVPIYFLGSNKDKEVHSLLISLGSSTSQAKEAISF